MVNVQRGAVYDDQFGAVQTAYVAYKAYDFSQTDSIQLYWPTSYQNSPNVVAAFMEVSDPIPGASELILPDATQVSVGQNFIVSNTGSTAFEILDFNDNVLQTINAGTVYYFILSDNSTSSGVWENFVFGAGTSTATADDLYGYGLNPWQARLNTQVPLQEIAPSDSIYNVLYTDYTSTLVWTANSGDIILPETASANVAPQVPPFWYVSINNAGGGQITVTTADNAGIQGKASLQIAPNQTVTLISIGDAINIDGIPTKWFTLGFGVQNPNPVTSLAINVGGNSDINLTTQQASNLILEFQGTLTGNIVVYFPIQTGEWFVYNQTIGSFTLSVQLGSIASPTGNEYLVGQQERLIFFSDGSSLFNIPTNGIPPGATEVGQVLRIDELNPQEAGWGPIVNYAANTLTIGQGVLTPNDVLTNPSVIMGINCGYDLYTGTGDNVIVGIDCFRTATTSSSCTILGSGADTANGLNNVTVIGAAAYGNISNAVILGDLCNVGIGTTTPTYGLHLGPQSGSYHPFIYISSSPTQPTAPSANDGAFFVSNGQLEYLSGTAKYSGSVVTANTTAGAPTAGVTSLGGTGTFTIATAAVTASSIVLITVQGDAPIAGTEITVSAVVANTSFTVTSSDNMDNRSVAWLIVNPGSL